MKRPTSTVEAYARLTRCASWIISEWRRSNRQVSPDPHEIWIDVKYFIDEYNDCEPSATRITTLDNKRDVYRLIVSAISFDGIAPYQVAFTGSQLANGLERIGHNPAHASGYTVPDCTVPTAIYQSA